MSRPLGILMLDTRFPRIPGDIGNPASFDFPVIFRRMEGLGPGDAVAAHPDRARVLSVLVANARALVEAGAVGLSTSCGFLALYQDELAAALPVPVATSALLHIRRNPDRRIGVLTASARNLTPAHFAAVGAPPETVTRRYHPVHNVGHFRYLEANHVGENQQPEGDITLWEIGRAHV